MEPEAWRGQSLAERTAASAQVASARVGSAQAASAQVGSAQVGSALAASALAASALEAGIVRLSAALAQAALAQAEIGRFVAVDSRSSPFGLQPSRHVSSHSSCLDMWLTCELLRSSRTGSCFWLSLLMTRTKRMEHESRDESPEVCHGLSASSCLLLAGTKTCRQ